MCGRQSGRSGYNNPGSGGGRYFPGATGLGALLYFYSCRELSRRQDRNRRCVPVTLPEAVEAILRKYSWQEDLALSGK